MDRLATFVLVHGAWRGGWLWARLSALRRAAGHEVFTPTLTGVGERAHLAHPGVNLTTPIQDVVGVLAYEELDNVLLVGHSYADLVIAGVAERVPERLAHLVYLDAIYPVDGEGWADISSPDARANREAVIQREGDAWRLPPNLVSGLPDADAAWINRRLVPQPAETWREPVRLGNPAAAALPQTFIQCSAPPAMAERARAVAGLRYRELAGGHDPMVTVPHELAPLLLEALT
jgi:pimeloyl-ACP methyl ester carboxylesterase